MGDFNFDEDEVPDEAVELFRDYVKNELQAAEYMEELADRYSVDDINKAATIVYDDTLPNVEDIQRERIMYIILARVGDTIGSQSMVENAKKGLEELSGQ